MSNFKGYLIKDAKNGNIFPHKYINYETWSTTPNQREELEAYRDDYTRDLYRNTSIGRKSVYSFETRRISLAEKQEIFSFFKNATVDEAQRKVYLEMWNDENDAYYKAYFYIPDIEYTIRKITDDDILYNEITIELIEY